MMIKPYLIANMRTGLERDLEPWLLPEDAFPQLEDCYMFRGRIPRRKGFLDLGRLVTSISAEAVGTVTTPWTQFSGTLSHTDVSPGSITITIGALTLTDDGVFGDQTGNLNTSPVSDNVGTINYITGDIFITFLPALGIDTGVTADYDYYNKLPIMGLRTYEINIINQEQLIAFDEDKANLFSTDNNRFIDISSYNTSGTPFSWTGGNADFFYSYNYANAFWETNFIRGFQPTWNASAGNGDGIRWYDQNGWANFLPAINGARAAPGTIYLMGALLIIPYRGRLVMLNTIEGSAYDTYTNYQQRARWSQNGTPYNQHDKTGNTITNPGGVTGDDDSWRSDIAGKGGYVDASTSEQIVSAKFFKDDLIVFFERSTWMLRYTGDPLLPFIWERISIELGAESTFSIVPFENGIVAVGNYGIMKCDTTGVVRIDQIIPDEVFKIHNGNDGVKRVHGIRDYTKQLVYWTFPSASSNPTFPNRILVYNYIEGSYSFFNDSFTCFGNYQPFNDKTWANTKVSWESFPDSWNSAKFQSDYSLIVAGNQQGFVLQNINNGPIINDYSLIITHITQASSAVITSTNHNLLEGTIIKINNVAGMTEVNGNIYRVSLPTTNTFKIQTLDENNNFIDVDSTSFSPYTSGGRILVRNNFLIETKRFNPFLSQGEQIRLHYCDFFLNSSSTTDFSVKIFLDENDNSEIETDISIPSSSYLGKVWVRTYFSALGQFIQMNLSFSDVQIFDESFSNGNLTIHAMMLWMSNAGRLTYGMDQL